MLIKKIMTFYSIKLLKPSDVESERAVDIILKKNNFSSAEER